VTCARAIIRELYHAGEGARVMSKALSGLGEFAVMSAPLGGLMSELLNWRAALLVLALFGAASLALALVRFKESLPDDAVQPLHPVALMRNWLHIAGNSTIATTSAPLEWAAADSERCRAGLCCPVNYDHGA